MPLGVEKKPGQSWVLEGQSNCAPLPRDIRAGSGRIGMSLPPSREPGAGIEPEQVAGSRHGAPVTRKKPPTLTAWIWERGGDPCLREEVNPGKTAAKKREVALPSGAAQFLLSFSSSPVGSGAG